MSELVSIITTLYNYRRYIGDLIKSVLAQTYENWEHVIVDDGSTDNPYSIIGKYQDGTARFRYLTMPKNEGYSAAKNVGIQAAFGKYIVMIDADDMLTPDSIRLRKEALDKHPDKLWCHGEVLVTDSGTDRNHRSRDWKRNFRKHLITQGMDLEKDYHHRLIHAQSVMVRPELHRKLGLYDESLRFSSDNEMWRRVIRFGHIPAHIDDFVAVYRVHNARMSRSKYKRDRMKEVKRKIIKDVEKRFQEGINAGNTKLWE